MAISSTSTIFSIPNVTTFIYIKLDGPNYLTWHHQLTFVLGSNELMGFMDGSKTFPCQFLLDAEQKETSTINPDIVLWTMKDQYLLSLINATLIENILATILGMTTFHQVWTFLSTKFASQSCSRVTHLKHQLHHLHQGSKSCSNYHQFAKQWADELAAVSKPVDDDDLVSYVINGLNTSFNPFVMSISIVTREKTYHV